MEFRISKRQRPLICIRMGFPKLFRVVNELLGLLALLVREVLLALLLRFRGILACHDCEIARQASECSSV